MRKEKLINLRMSQALVVTLDPLHVPIQGLRPGSLQHGSSGGGHTASAMATAL